MLAGGTGDVSQMTQEGALPPGLAVRGAVGTLLRYRERGGDQLPPKVGVSDHVSDIATGHVTTVQDARYR